MTASAPIGVLLVQLGTPDSPSVPDVRRYLAEFLADPRVIDIHPVSRWLLLNLVILRTRPKNSAHAYQKIWTDRGSPLLFHSQDLAAALQTALGQGHRVALGMRYGQPALAGALAELQRAGCDHVVVVPLYPQYSSAATASALDAVLDAARELPAVPALYVINEFHAHPAFIDATAAVVRDHLGDGWQGEGAPDHWLFSYHGVPERQVRGTEIPGPDGAVAGHCLGSASCCDALVPANRQCYRAQCYATSRALAAALGLSRDDYTVSFQSRLGRTPWIQPYTDVLLPELAQRYPRLAVLTPSFTADCLETIEEIGIRAVDDFRQAGGAELLRVPCVNAHPAWVDGLAGLVRAHGPTRA